MPGKTVKFGDTLYCWNSTEKRVERVFIKTEPVVLSEVPLDVIQELMELIDNTADSEDNV